jgi:diaminopimelate epimerase
MKILFYKYQGTGNDFVMLDNLNGNYDDLSIDQIQKLCDRRFGVGADGLIKINKHKQLDFEMDYYNSDGSKSFCGNGARCAVAFAAELGIDVKETRFLAIDGPHSAFKIGDQIRLEMSDVDGIEEWNDAYIVNTGSPHFIKGVDNLNDRDIVSFGKEIRYSEPFIKDGINVNLIERTGRNDIRIATYERGVEDETLSCGTGATACALVCSHLLEEFGEQYIRVKVKGGELLVGFCRQRDGSFDHVTLSGPAVFVFKGEVHV